MPRTRQLGLELTGLAGQIAALEARLLPDNGGWGHSENTRVSDEEIVTGVLTTLSVGPSAEEVLSWLAEVEQAVRRNHKNLEDFESIPRQVHVSWTGGKIDTNNSTICAQWIVSL